MDKYFEQAIKNISYYIDKCEVGLLINECKYDKYWTSRFGGVWYTFKLLESIRQKVEFSVSLPAIRDFNEDTVIYLGDFKWTLKNLLITKETVIGQLNGNIEKCIEDKEYYEDLIEKYKDK